MANQQLSKYVKEQLQQGGNKEEVKKELLGAGWQEADINQALGIPIPTQPPRPPSAPSFTPADPQKLNSIAVWLFFVRYVFVFQLITIWLGFGFIDALSDTTTGAWVMWLSLFLISSVFAFIWAKLTYHFYRYELTEEGFRKELGIISKKYTTIPYDRIQNVDIHRGIMARILRLSDLSIQTAGMSAGAGRFSLSAGVAEGTLPGLSREVAEQLRSELVRRARQTKSQGL